MNQSMTRTLALVALFTGIPHISWGQQPVWSEEFESGTVPDENVWSYDLGDSGWGNQELQNYTDDPENVRIEDGNLVITVKRTEDGTGFTSGRIRTQDKLTFKYGRIEARIQVPDLADGLWPAFWTLGNNFSSVGWPYCGELDIMEMGNAQAISNGVINRRVGSAAHWDNNGSWASFSRYLDAPADLDDGYHLFSMNWTPTQVTTYLDGAEIWSFTIDPEVCTGCSEFHQPHFIILNMAVGGNYTGLLTPGLITADLPAELKVDYIRIYDNGYTELEGTSLDDGPVIGQQYSGSWYNPDQSGHGFSMEFGESLDGTPVSVVYWYTYDTDGKPIFLVGQGTPTENAVDLDVISPYGMEYGLFIPETVVREDAGTARLVFTDEATATFSYQPSEFSRVAWGHSEINDLPLVKFFAIPITDGSNENAAR